MKVRERDILWSLDAIFCPSSPDDGHVHGGGDGEESEKEDGSHGNDPHVCSPTQFHFQTPFFLLLLITAAFLKSRVFKIGYADVLDRTQKFLGSKGQ
ncbi:hypothetical protein L1987_29695 [Smallanthus sonchifolius]|uniref:Uncharacterized protein n=1 Tax=Smallanthus sonchifolius TaxID=185202 RepID=A0ACB9I210_9ASTR|nr:hypothetical protein L1987_29695 [Smallanthus sonchifolius]